MINLKEILYDYAYTKGGGLPLTPEEMCNAVVQWVQKYVKDIVNVKDREYVAELTNKDNFITLSKSANANGGNNYDINIDKNTLYNNVVSKPDVLPYVGFPVVNEIGDMQYMPLSKFEGKLYRHQITVKSDNGFTYFDFYSTNSNPITEFSDLLKGKYLAICNYYAEGRGFGEFDIASNAYFVGFAGENTISKVSVTLINISSVTDNVTKM